MQEDLKIIKNKYGEKMMQLCRKMFPTILETPSLLPDILLEHFEPTRFLYDDIIDNNLQDSFKHYIYDIFNYKIRSLVVVDKTPSELLEEVGYNLYECKTEKDLQSFRKYYAKGEELCSFEDRRLDRCHIFFAVKKDANKIKRKDFITPERQDEYGTSVISIQFEKDENHILSIKNRYNSKVENADATFSNNLENIIPGLTESFARTYGLKQRYTNSKFKMPGYVKADDGKYYKYNYKINDIYYCPNNIIIDKLEVKRYPQEKYIVFDYFILDLSNGIVILYDENIKDSFQKTITESIKVQTYKENEIKKVVLTLKNSQNVVIVLDSKNNLIGYQNLNSKEIKDDFLSYDYTLRKLDMTNVEKIGHNCLRRNDELEEFDFPKTKEIGNNFDENNTVVKKVDFSLTEKIGDWFLSSANNILEAEFNKLKEVGSGFICRNLRFSKISFSELEIAKDNFLAQAYETSEIVRFSKLKKVGNRFMLFNQTVKKGYFDSLEETGDDFLGMNGTIEEFYSPNLEKIGIRFLEKCNVNTRNEILTEIVKDNDSKLNTLQSKKI